VGGVSAYNDESLTVARVERHEQMVVTDTSCQSGSHVTGREPCTD
jgi:hypothetical protein